jgi:hypothetical protein
MMHDPAGYDSLAPHDAPHSAEVGSDGLGVSKPFLSPETGTQPIEETPSPAPFANQGRKKNKPAVKIPTRIRLLRDIGIATQSGVLAFKAMTIEDDPFRVAVVVNSDAKYEEV